MNNYLDAFRMNMKFYREALGISQTQLSILCDCGTGTIGGINTCKINEFVVICHYKINDFEVL